MLNILICSVVIATLMITSAPMVNAMEPDDRDPDESSEISFITQLKAERLQKQLALKAVVCLLKNIQKDIKEEVEKAPPETHAQMYKDAESDLVELRIERNKIRRKIYIIDKKIIKVDNGELYYK